MYTEMIVGCALVNLPTACVEALDYVINKCQNKNKAYQDFIEGKSDISFEAQDFIKRYDLYYMIYSQSCYFGAPSTVSFHTEMWWNGKDIHFLSIRSNCKNYDGKIQNFLEFLRPYVYEGSGPNNIYGYMHYEEDDFPVIYNTRSQQPVYIKKDETR